MELTKKSLIKRIIITCMMFCLVFSLAVCNASESGNTQADFVNDLTTGINADSMWGAVRPVATIIIFVFIFAFGYRIIRRVLKKGSQGKFGM